MALIRCHECQAEISDTAAVCPHCGAPSKKVVETAKFVGGMQAFVAVCVVIITILSFVAAMMDS